MIHDVPLTSYSKREGGVVNAIVLHDSEGFALKETLHWFADASHRLSMHYVIAKDGSVFRCVPDEFKAWHAGSSVLHGENNVNDFSLGVCLVDTPEGDRFPEDQTTALLNLCETLCRTYDIPLNRVVGHAHVAIGKRTDPHVDFPWYEFLNTLGSCLINE